MDKIGLLRDRLYVPASLINQGHLEAYTHRYYTRVTEPVTKDRNCLNCQYWQKPWRDSDGKQQYCHLLGYTEENVCSDFEARTVTREVENILVTYKTLGGSYAFARGDLAKLARTFPDFTLQDERAKPPMGVPLKFTSQLRPDQIPIVEDWLAAQHGIIRSPTGSGKSVLLAWLIAHLGVRTLVLSHERRHLTTLYERFAEHTNLRELESQGLKVIDQFIDGQGIAPITLSTFQAWNSDKGRKLLLENQDTFGLVWVDECFVGSTLVDGRRIDSLRAGDHVSCFDPQNPGTVLTRQIKRVMAKAPFALVRLCIGGKDLVCTPNHRIWTSRGWVPASLCEGLEVLVDASEKAIQRPVRLLWDWHRQETAAPKLRIVLPRLQDRSTGTTTEDSSASMFALWNSSDREGENSIGVGCERSRLLQRRAQNVSQESNQLANSRAHQQEVCFRTHAYEESNAYPGQYRQDGGGYEGQDFLGSWGQWPADATAGRISHRTGVGNGSFDPYGSSEGHASITAPLLQSGHRRSSKEDSNRSRREDTQAQEVDLLGQKEDTGFRGTRVDRVEVLERGSDGTFGGLCPDGFVYNLEVDDVHTYFANGIGVSNCHHTSATSYHNVFSSFNAYYRGGTTATPTRKDQTHWATYDAIGPITAEGGNAMLSCDVRWCPTGVDIPNHFFRFDFKVGWVKMLNYISESQDVRQLLLKNVIAEIEQGRKPLVIVERRAMAVWLERMVNFSGYNAALVMGGERKGSKSALKQSQSFDDIGRRLLDGTLHCVIGTKVLNENIDIRPLDTLHLPFPSSNREMEEQRAGRIRRTLSERDIADGFVKPQPIITVYTYGGHKAANAAHKTRREVYQKLGFNMGDVTVSSSKKRKLSLVE